MTPRYRVHTQSEFPNLQNGCWGVRRVASQSFFPGWSKGFFQGTCREELWKGLPQKQIGVMILIFQQPPEDTDVVLDSLFGTWRG